MASHHTTSAAREAVATYEKVTAQHVTYVKSQYHTAHANYIKLYGIVSALEAPGASGEGTAHVSPLGSGDDSGDSEDELEYEEEADVLQELSGRATEGRMDLS